MVFTEKIKLVVSIRYKLRDASLPGCPVEELF